MLAKDFSFDLLLVHLKRSSKYWKDVFGVSRLFSGKINDERIEIPTDLRHGSQLIANGEYMNAAIYFGKITPTFNSSLLVLACRSLVNDFSVLQEYSAFLKASTEHVKTCHPAILFFSLSVIMNQKAQSEIKDQNEYSRNARLSYGYGLAFLNILETYSELVSWKPLITNSILKLKDTMWTIKIAPVDSETPSQKRWREEKERNFTQNPAMDKLMGLIGLESVKDMFLNIFDSVTINLRRNMSIKDKRLNVCFTGNPGTGIDYYLVY